MLDQNSREFLLARFSHSRPQCIMKHLEKSRNTGHEPQEASMDIRIFTEFFIYTTAAHEGRVRGSELRVGSPKPSEKSCLDIAANGIKIGCIDNKCRVFNCINGVVVTWVVAIDPPGVRFPLNAYRAVGDLLH